MKRVERAQRKKIGTILDEKVLTAAKILAAKEHKRLSQVIEEALTEYLRRKRLTSVVLQTRGAIKIAPELLHRILEEEPGVFEV